MKITHIDETALELFKKIVTDHVGLHMHKDDSTSFITALTVRMKSLNITDYAGYAAFLESGSAESIREWKALSIAITTGETYFFRDKGLFYLLQHTILPELIEKNRIKHSLRIWSAGCASGEEPYSIAILLDMLLSDRDEWDVHIIGTDINEVSLKKAARGIYTQWSFRKPGENIQKKYFKKHLNEWEINPSIKKMVRFKYSNLIDGGVVPEESVLKNMDLIICRNVFIYFEKPAVAMVLNIFKKTLNNGGYLVAGHAELYGHDLTHMRQIMFPEAMLYRKTDESDIRTVEISRLPDVGKEAIQIKIPHAKPVLQPLKLNIEKGSIHNSEIELLISKGRYHEAVAVTENLLSAHEDDYGLLYLSAEAAANAGDYARAALSCRRAIAVNADSPDIYFLFAQVEAAGGHDNEAKLLLKKALYLDPGFVAAYFELGSLYEKEHDNARAQKARYAAIGYLKALPPSSPVDPYDITAGELLAYIEYLIDESDTAIMPVRRIEMYNEK